MLFFREGSGMCEGTPAFVMTFVKARASGWNEGIGDEERELFIRSP
jgi:hypothetical protein